MKSRSITADEIWALAVSLEQELYLALSLPQQSYTKKLSPHQGGSRPKCSTSEHSKSTRCGPASHPDASSPLSALALFSELSRLLVLLFHFPEDTIKAMKEKPVEGLPKVSQQGSGRSIINSQFTDSLLFIQCLLQPSE